MTRPRAKHIKVYGTDEELAKLKRLAASANLSYSDYLRTAGLNLPVRSVLDVHAVTELSKVNGKLGEMAEALKAHDGRPDVARAIKILHDMQKQTHEIMGRIMR
jgi:hypothetical protein